MAARLLDRFERFITHALLVLIGAVILLATVELAWLLLVWRLVRGAPMTAAFSHRIFPDTLSRQ